MPEKFNSPQRVKARCFAVFASALGWVACSSAAIRTSNAADFVAGSSPARQINSASAAIFSSLREISRVLKPDGRFYLLAGGDHESHGHFGRLIHSTERLKDNSEQRILKLVLRAVRVRR